jgi:4a-hydroxytetrahydrobiopterin dehydratase
MARRILLADTDIAERLTEIPDWMRVGQTIERTWKFKDFVEALSFINAVGKAAEKMNHHPDIHNSWNRVTLRLTTHDRGGLTNLDCDLAKKIDGLHAK